MTEQIDVVTFKNILNEYLNNKLNDTIAVNIKLSVKYEDVNMGVNLEIYYLYDNNTIYLTEDDINEALTNYVQNKGYILNNYMYDGYVRKMGMYVDEDTPLFYGVILSYDKQKVYKKD